VLALLAAWPRRRTKARPPSGDAAVQPWAGGRWAVVAVLAVGAVISGATGVAVFGAVLGLRYALHNRRRLASAVTLGLSAGGMILAGAALSRHPWRSVDGYAGHGPAVQLLALVSLAAVAASVTVAGRASARGGAAQSDPASVTMPARSPDEEVPRDGAVAQN
jgi:arabinofuranan 3-O-arabinosyltransferase